jgi:polyhydroxyalkanoate synthesis repressor PhaR
MIRLIKRYESRKLYDTEESRYVSLEEIAGWVRQGQEVKVVDNATGADVTSQTLTQIILDEGRRGTSFLPSDLLHDLVRIGEKAMHTGIEQVQNGVDRLVQSSIDRLAPVRRVREEMTSLRARLEQLEASLADLENEPTRPEPALAGEPVLVGPESAISRPFGREEKSE